MSYFLSPIGNAQQFDANGDPLVGGQIATYLAGATTPAATYTSSAGTTPQANPIALDSLGAPASPIWLAGGVSYKLVIKNAAGVTLRTIDNIGGVNDITGTASEWVDSGLVPTYISATSFSVPGDQTSALQVGRRLRTVNTAGTAYSRISASSYAAGPAITTVTVVNDSTTLDSGLSSVAYGLLAPNNPSLPNSAAVRASLGASTVGDAVFTAASASAARDSLGVGSAISNRNRLMNGNFAVNQRAVAGAVVLAAGVYGHDRWKAGAAGCSYTFATSGNDTVITISAGSLIQVVEDKNVEGGVYALQNAGTALARIAVNGAATSGAYAAATSAAPLLSASATANQTVSVEFTTGTVSKAQLEPGTVATPFERRPIGAELALCQRYYETGKTFSDSYGAAATSYSANSPFKVTKRAAPTMTGNFTYSNTSGGNGDNISAEGFRSSCAVTATGAAAFTNTWTASAEL